MDELAGQTFTSEPAVPIPPLLRSASDGKLSFPPSPALALSDASSHSALLHAVSAGPHSARWPSMVRKGGHLPRWLPTLAIGVGTALLATTSLPLTSKLALAAALRSIVLRPEEPSEQQQQASSVVALAGAGGH